MSVDQERLPCEKLGKSHCLHAGAFEQEGGRAFMVFLSRTPNKYVDFTYIRIVGLCEVYGPDGVKITGKFTKRACCRCQNTLALHAVF